MFKIIRKFSIQMFFAESTYKMLLFFSQYIGEKIGKVFSDSDIKLIFQFLVHLIS